MASYITDPVTTTDELIPSGETSSYRSNPLGLAEFTSAARTPPMWGAPGRAGRGSRPPGRAGDAALLEKIRAVPGCEA
ncbi:MAG: hypothetical protein ACLTMO_07845 [Faecalibacterium prausnitzii]